MESVIVATPGETIRFEAGGAVPERIDLFDLRGRQVRSWLGAEIGEGWDGRLSSGEPAPSGVYFVRIMVGDDVGTFRIVRLR